MRQIEKNPFRVLGLSVEASDKEITKRVSDLEIFAEMGKTQEYDSDLSFLAPITRTPELIKEASQQIEQPKNKFYQSLWWFWINNSVDELALEVLQSGNLNKALSLWYEAIKDSEPNHKNISNYKNLGLLALWTSKGENRLKKKNLKSGLRFTGRFMQCDAFNVYKSSVIKDHKLYDLEENKEEFLEHLYDDLKRTYSNGKAISEKEFLSFVHVFPSKARKKVKESVIHKPIINIEREINDTITKRNDQPAKASSFGIELYNLAKDDVEFLNEVLSEEDLEYQLVVDKLAEEILQCSITYFNYHLDNTDIDPGESSLRCARIAEELAIGSKAKNRIQDNLPTIKEWVENKEERELLKEVQDESNFIYTKLKKVDSSDPSDPINILQTLYPSDRIKRAIKLVESCKPKLKSIRSKLGRSNQFYRDISNAVVNVALNISIEVVNKSQSGAVAYDRIAKDNMISAISSSYDLISKINELDMFGNTKTMFDKNKKIITDMYNQIYGRSSSYTSSSSSSGTQGGCYIATMVYGDYDHPKVQILRTFRDEVLVKKILGRLFIKMYYKFSPRLVRKLQDRPNINNAIKLLLDKTLISWFKK